MMVDGRHSQVMERAETLEKRAASMSKESKRSELGGESFRFHLSFCLVVAEKI